MIYTIEVTAQDIVDGERRNPTKCPVSLAMSRVLGYPVSTGASHFFVIREDWGLHSLPKKVTPFVIDFDSNRDVTPFTFQVELEDGKNTA